MADIDNAPVYTQEHIYIQCTKRSRGAFHVTFIDHEEGNDWDSWLKRASISEIAQNVRKGWPIYVPVKHPLEYPYSAYDCQADDDELLKELGWGDPAGTKFCEAALVGTPKMKLI